MVHNQCKLPPRLKESAGVEKANKLHSQIRSFVHRVPDFWKNNNRKWPKPGLVDGDSEGEGLATVRWVGGMNIIDSIGSTGVGMSQPSIWQCSMPTT